MRLSHEGAGIASKTKATKNMMMSFLIRLGDSHTRCPKKISDLNKFHIAFLSFMLCFIVFFVFGISSHMLGRDYTFEWRQRQRNEGKKAAAH